MQGDYWSTSSLAQPFSKVNLSEIGSSMCATESSVDGLLLPSVTNRFGGILGSEAFRLAGWGMTARLGSDRLKPATFDVRLVRCVRHA